MAWSWRNDADAVLATLALSSTPTTAWLWWNYGTPGAGPPTPVYLPFEQEDPGAPGTYLVSGLPALDEQLLQVEVIDSANPGSDTAFTPVLVGPSRIGTGRPLILSTAWRGNCALKFRFQLLDSLASGASSTPYGYRLWPRTGTAPASTAPALMGDGIVTSLGDSTISEWLLKVAVTETGTPDDKANIAARTALWKGQTTTWAGEAVTLNQNDGAAAALTAGQAYYAILTQGLASVTTTKGVKATAGSQVLPASPAGELPITIVTVSYGAGGSVINQADIVETSTASRAHVRAGTGLFATLGTYRAWIGRVYYESDIEQSITLPASLTKYVWLDEGGTVSLTATTTKPSDSAILLSVETTDGSGITSGPTDQRALYWEPRAEHLRLAQTGNETVAVAQRKAVGYPGSVDRASSSVRIAAAGGATGNTAVSLVRTRAGSDTTLATGTIAAGAYTGTLTFTGHDVLAGDYLSLDVTGATTGGTRATEVALDVVVAPSA